MATRLTVGFSLLFPLVFGQCLITKSGVLAYEVNRVEIDGQEIPGTVGARERFTMSLCGREDVEVNISGELFIAYLDLFPAPPYPPEGGIQLLSASVAPERSAEWKDGFAYRKKWPTPSDQWLPLPLELRPQIHLRFSAGRPCGTTGKTCDFRLSFRCPDGRRTEASVLATVTDSAAKTEVAPPDSRDSLTQRQGADSPQPAQNRQPPGAWDGIHR